MTDSIPEDEIDDRLAKFDGIQIGHPRLKAIRTSVHALCRQTKNRLAQNEQRRREAGGRPIKDSELWLLPIIGPSGSMKSKSLEIVIDEIYADPAVNKSDIPVLPVTMRGIKNPRILQAQILQGYDDAAAAELRRTSRGWGLEAVNEAIGHAARAKNTCAFALDEAHEILRYDGGKMGGQMMEALKGIVNQAVASLIISGTRDARRLFNSELSNRVMTEAAVNLNPFRVQDLEDRKYFFGFIKRLEEHMLEDGVVDRRLGFTDSLEDRARLFDIEDGILGTVHRIVRNSLLVAFRAGRRHLEWDDMAAAFRGWNAAKKQPRFDPFARGPEKNTLAVLKSARTAEAARERQTAGAAI